MEPIERNKTIDKVKTILHTINLMIEKLTFTEDENDMIFIQDIEDIIKEQKLFENIDMKRISSYEKKYITIDEFKASDIFTISSCLNDVSPFMREYIVFLSISMISASFGSVRPHLAISALWSNTFILLSSFLEICFL